MPCRHALFCSRRRLKTQASGASSFCVCSLDGCPLDAKKPLRHDTAPRIHNGVRVEILAEAEHLVAANADGLQARDIYFLKNTSDSLGPESREERARIERAIQRLRERKNKMSEDTYYSELEVLMRAMAKLYSK